MNLTISDDTYWRLYGKIAVCLPVENKTPEALPHKMVSKILIWKPNMILSLHTTICDKYYKAIFSKHIKKLSSLYLKPSIRNSALYVHPNYFNGSEDVCCCLQKTDK